MGKYFRNNQDTKVHTKSHISHMSNNGKKLHDFKTNGASANINKQLIKAERNQFYIKALITFVAVIIGLILLTKNIKDKIIFKCLAFEFTCMHAGLAIIILSLVLFFKHSKYNVEIKNQK